LRDVTELRDWNVPCMVVVGIDEEEVNLLENKINMPNAMGSPDRKRPGGPMEVRVSDHIKTRLQKS